MNANPTTKFSWKKAVLLSLGVGLLAAGLSIFTQVRVETMQGSAEDPKPVIAASAVAGLGSSFDAPGVPARLIIPAIGVDAAVQSVGLAWQGNGEMGIPTNFTDTGWYNLGPRPGMPGNAVIDGHLDGRNVPRAVFYRLGNLKPGDLVEVRDKQGNLLKFRVVAVTLYDYNSDTAAIFNGDSSRARLNLITCAGDWMKTKKLYSQRVVVSAELITASSTNPS